MNFDRFIIKMEEYECSGDIHAAAWALYDLTKNRPSETRKSVILYDYVNQLSWVKDPERFVNHLVTRRIETSKDAKDFYNRSVLQTLSLFIEDEQFWFPVCLKYPDYLKYYSKADDSFKTAIRIVA